MAAAATALTLGMAGTALAAPLSKPKPKPAPAAQITGSKLAAGLLPGADFGGGDTTSGPIDTGNSLLSAKHPQGVSSLSCTFAGLYFSGYGQTAAATDVFSPPVGHTGGPFGSQLIYQFASSSAASSFLAQEAARFQSRACRNQTTNTNQGTTLTVTLKRLSWTKIGGYPAIDVTQSDGATNALGVSLSTSYNVFTVVDAGTNVYTIWEAGSSDAGVPASLLSHLIRSTQKLYPKKK